MIIREETTDDYGEIYEFVKEAFKTAKVKDGDEQDYVNTLREGNNYIKELALVAQKDKEIIGHIMFTKTYVMDENNKYEFLLLSPLSVKLEERCMGVGGRLIAQGFEIAGTLGYKAVFIVGDPKYYSRFGFNTIDNYSIDNSTGIPNENVMAYELVRGALCGIKGDIRVM